MDSSVLTKAMPVLFAAHGAPMLLEDEAWMAEFRAWAGSLPRPKSILVVSAHWENTPVAIGSTTAVPLIYDFYGFPERFYKTQYAAPGAPELASRVRDVLRSQSIPFVDEPTRGLDHGAYVPLVAMYPSAEIPVLQISLPELRPSALIRLGEALRCLRGEGVLILGSGFLTHNMQYAFRKGIPAWAREFDDWATRALADRDMDSLADFMSKAPAARTALPTWEHYAPVLISAGAASSGESVSFPITGFWMDGAFSRRSVQFG